MSHLALYQDDQGFNDFADYLEDRIPRKYWESLANLPKYKYELIEKIIIKLFDRLIVTDYDEEGNPFESGDLTQDQALEIYTRYIKRHILKK